MNAVNPLIPPGYRTNACGHLVPEEAISPLEKQSDELVRDLVKKARALQAAMRAFKRAAMSDLYAHRQLVADKYEAKLGGEKGNITIRSFDGLMRVEINTAEFVTLGEEIHAAKALIDACIHKWAADSGKEIRALVEHTFQTDKQGRFNVGRILALTRLDFDDADWKSAMQAIKDAMRVVTNKSYLRFSERSSQDKKFEPIVLDLAGL